MTTERKNNGNPAAMPSRAHPWQGVERPFVRRAGRSRSSSAARAGSGRRLPATRRTGLLPILAKCLPPCAMSPASERIGPEEMDREEMVPGGDSWPKLTAGIRTTASPC